MYNKLLQPNKALYDLALIIWPWIMAHDAKSRKSPNERGYIHDLVYSNQSQEDRLRFRKYRVPIKLWAVTDCHSPMSTKNSLTSVHKFSLFIFLFLERKNIWITFYFLLDESFSFENPRCWLATWHLRFAERITNELFSAEEKIISQNG